MPILFKDWNPTIRKRTWDLWNESWEKEERALKEIKPTPGKWVPLRKKTRREEVVVNRLRVEHTRLTQEYLFTGEVEGQRPLCEWCREAVLTVKRIVINCPALREKRNTCFKSTRQNRKFSDILGEKSNIGEVMEFIKEIEIWSKI